MRSLTVLGSCAWPEAGRACAGFLAEYDGFRVVLDLGTPPCRDCSNTARSASVAEAKQVFDGEVIAAEEGLTVTL